ncbi:hypothetical protein [Nocardia jiangxiensis]|uniref:TniQ protein n=1 Tax=Nocardia jiangxiensis TaxID=282685 RepID=A0ABW6RW67_9NOCA|nr:hypothetical protein [Nocardia jiangxiensis]
MSENTNADRGRNQVDAAVEEFVSGDGDARSVRSRLVDVAEERLRLLVPGLDRVRPGPAGRVADALTRRWLRTLIGVHLTDFDITPTWRLPFLCGVERQGCPRHGDLLEFAGWRHGWRCPVDGCGYIMTNVVMRAMHCQQLAVAVLTDADGVYELPVCEGHLRSEVENASYGGEPFTVIMLDDQAAA